MIGALGRRRRRGKRSRRHGLRLHHLPQHRVVGRLFFHAGETDPRGSRLVEQLLRQGRMRSRLKGASRPSAGPRRCGWRRRGLQRAGAPTTDNGSAAARPAECPAKCNRDQIPQTSLPPRLSRQATFRHASWHRASIKEDARVSNKGDSLPLAQELRGQCATMGEKRKGNSRTAALFLDIASGDGGRADWPLAAFSRPLTG